MPRRKQVAPMPRIDSGEIMRIPSDEPEPRAIYSNAGANGSTKHKYTNGHTIPRTTATAQASGSIVSLVICVGGIYASFLTWGLLQERITTTPYPSSSKLSSDEFFRYPIFVNAIQALFAFISGSVYLYTSTGQYTLIPSRAFGALLVVSLTTTLASPFGYASLAHVDYLTFVLAKSCKLLPVMALHVTLFNKRYPLSKYLIVLAVTAGVAVFTLYHPPKHGKKVAKSSYYGLSLLGVNLLFDGLTNVMQDHVFKSPTKYGMIKGPQMMVSTNLLGFLVQAGYLLLMPWIPAQVLAVFGVDGVGDLGNALAFIKRHPAVLNDILGFCVAGAIGQLFIFATLERFSSLVLVTVTVTRKMLTMVLSVVWYGKRLAPMQWVGVVFVFGGVVAEGWLSQKEKERKKKELQELAGKMK